MVAVTTGLAGCGSGSAAPGVTPSGTTTPSGDTQVSPSPTTTGSDPAGSAVGSSASSTKSDGSGSQVVLTSSGLGGVPLGSPLSAFATRLGHEPSPLTATDRQVLAEHRCVVRSLSGEPGLGLKVIGTDPAGQVQVISLTDGSPIRTSAGVALGDSMVDARRAYRTSVVQEPFDFHPDDGSAFAASAAHGARWVFIANHDGRLVEIRLGFRPDVYAPEGCV
jgi:hypothetical protein